MFSPPNGIGASFQSVAIDMRVSEIPKVVIFIPLAHPSRAESVLGPIPFRHFYPVMSMLPSAILSEPLSTGRF